MDSFFNLFDEIDLAYINEILINPEENKKVYNIYKNLKESANLAIVASQVCESKKRFVEQTGAALSEVEQILKTPIIIIMLQGIKLIIIGETL